MKNRKPTCPVCDGNLDKLHLENQYVCYACKSLVTGRPALWTKKEAVWIKIKGGDGDESIRETI